MSLENTVVSFKLRGGAEVVATVASVNTDAPAMLTETKGRGKKPASTGAIVSYTVRKPHILQMQPMGNGNVGLAFVPWTLSNPTIDRLDIPASEVILTFSPSANCERQYLEQTTGLTMATPGGRISS